MKAFLISAFFLVATAVTAAVGDAIIYVDQGTGVPAIKVLVTPANSTVFQFNSSGVIVAAKVTNAEMLNSSITINGSAVSLGGSVSNLLPTNGNGSQLTGLTESQIANLVADLAARQPLDGDLTGLANIAANNVIPYRIGANNWDFVAFGSNITFNGGIIDVANQKVYAHDTWIWSSMPTGAGSQDYFSTDSASISQTHLVTFDYYSLTGGGYIIPALLKYKAGTFVSFAETANGSVVSVFRVDADPVLTEIGQVYFQVTFIAGHDGNWSSNPIFYQTSVAPADMDNDTALAADSALVVPTQHAVKAYVDAKNAISALTGDVTASGPGSAAATLATVNSNVGTFGSATQSLTVTANAKGLVTAVSAQTITPAVGSITGLGTGVATFLTTPTLTNFNTALSDADVATLGANNVFTHGQTITEGTVNEGILTSTGYSLTGSNPTSMVSLAGTWNTTGTPTALKVNITNTASNAASRLIDLQFGGTSYFGISQQFVGTTAMDFDSGTLSIRTAGVTRANYGVSASSTWTFNASLGLRLADNGGTYFNSLVPISSGVVAIKHETPGTASAFEVYGDGATGAKKIRLEHNGTNGIISTNSGTITHTSVVNFGATNGTNITNVRHGISSAMVGGTVTVTDAGCTANTRYHLIPHTLGTVAVPQAAYVSTRNAGTSFVITSASLTDTSTWDWMAIEP